MTMWETSLFARREHNLTGFLSRANNSIAQQGKGPNGGIEENDEVGAKQVLCAYLQAIAYLCFPLFFAPSFRHPKVASGLACYHSNEHPL